MQNIANRFLNSLHGDTVEDALVAWDVIADEADKLGIKPVISEMKGIEFKYVDLLDNDKKSTSKISHVHFIDNNKKANELSFTNLRCSIFLPEKHVYISDPVKQKEALALQAKA